jgi:mono/diheme cytochrome c family protein
MRINPTRTCLFFMLATALGPGALPAVASGPGLAASMEKMQTYTHKLQLSVEARNAPLADFYLHELEEVTEHVVDNIAHYREYPIGDLTREMLVPAIEALEDAVDERAWDEADAGFSRMLEACNTCHQATGHGAIRIAPATMNPFAQDFSPVDD